MSKKAKKGHSASVLQAALSRLDAAIAQRNEMHGQLVTVTKERDDLETNRDAWSVQALRAKSELATEKEIAGYWEKQSNEWSALASKYRIHIDTAEGKMREMDLSHSLRMDEARQDLAREEAVVQRQRELLIRLRAIAEIAFKVSDKVLLMQESDVTRHYLFGGRCIVLGGTWPVAVAWARALAERGKVELEIDGLIAHPAGFSPKQSGVREAVRRVDGSRLDGNLAAQLTKQAEAQERVIKAAITFAEAAKHCGISLDRMDSKIIHEVYDSVRALDETFTAAQKASA